MYENFAYIKVRCTTRGPGALRGHIVSDALEVQLQMVVCHQRVMGAEK